MVLPLVLWPDARPAAPQIGTMPRLAVVDASGRRGQAVRMANPVVLHVSVQMQSHEKAAPSLSPVSAAVERPRAAGVQHQIGCLNGKTYFDRLPHLRRKMLVARPEKLRRAE